MFCVLLSSHSFHARIYKTPLQLQFNHLSCLLKGKFCICYCEHFISWATENKLSCSEYTRRSQTGRLYIDSENQRLRYCWCHFCCFSVKTCVHLGLTLFKVSSAASFSISKCLNINFGCLLAKCSPSCFIFQMLAIQWSGSFLSVHGVAFENMASSYSAC